MRKLVLAAAVMSALVCGTAMSYADTPNGNTGTASTPVADPNEMICKKGEVTTGSRFPGPPICHTRMEWEQLQRNAQEALNHLNGGTSGPH